MDCVCLACRWMGICSWGSQYLAHNNNDSLLIEIPRYFIHISLYINTRTSINIYGAGECDLPTFYLLYCYQLLNIINIKLHYLIILCRNKAERQWPFDNVGGGVGSVIKDIPQNNCFTLKSLYNGRPFAKKCCHHTFMEKKNCDQSKSTSLLVMIWTIPIHSLIQYLKFWSQRNKENNSRKNGCGNYLCW